MIIIIIIKMEFIYLIWIFYIKWWFYNNWNNNNNNNNGGASCAPQGWDGTAAAVAVKIVVTIISTPTNESETRSRVCNELCLLFILIKCL